MTTAPLPANTTRKGSGGGILHRRTGGAAAQTTSQAQRRRTSAGRACVNGAQTICSLSLEMKRQENNLTMTNNRTGFKKYPLTSALQSRHKQKLAEVGGGEER